MLKRILVYGLLLVALLLASAAAAFAWLLGTEDGLQWALSRAMMASQGRLAIEDARGRLAGTVRLGRAAWKGEGFAAELREVSTSADLLAALSGRLVLGPLRAESLTVAPGAGGDASADPPALGFGLRLWDAEVARLVVVRGEQRHELHAVRLEHFAIEAGAPPTVSAKAAFRLADERFPAQARLELDGDLQRLGAVLRLEDRGMTVDAKALLAPGAERLLQSLEARAAPMDLARFDASLPRTAIEIALSGKADPTAALRGTLSVRNPRPGPIDAGQLPFARADSRFVASDFSGLRLDALRVALAGGGRLEGDAEASLGRIRARLQATNVDLRALRSDLRRTALRGPLVLDAMREMQSLEGSVAQEGMSIAAHAVRRGTRVDVLRLRAAAAGGEATGTGRLDLTAALPFRAEIAFTRFDPSAFGDWPGGSISGAVSAAGRLGGEREVEAKWSVAESTLAGQKLTSRGTARLSHHRVTQVDAEATLGAARAAARGAFGRPGDQLVWTLEAPRLAELDARLEGSAGASGLLIGSWQRPQARIAARAQQLRFGNGPRLDLVEATLWGDLQKHEAGIVVHGPEIDLEADLAGGWGSEGWRGELRSAVNRGEYPLRLVSPAPLRFARDRLELGRLEALLGAGHLLVRYLRWTPETLASHGEFSRLPAHWLLLALGATRRFGGDLALDGTWSLSATPRIDGEVRIRRADGDLEILGDSPLALGLREAGVEAKFVKSRVALRAQAGSRFGDLDLRGEIAPAANAQGMALDAASTLALQGRIAFVDVRVLSASLIEQGRVDGKLSAELAATGTLGAPLLRGELRGDGVAVELPPYGVYLRNGSLRATLQGDRLQIDSFTITGGEGQFTAKGTLPLRLAEGDATIAWSATRFTVIERPEVRLITSGQGEASFDGRRLALVGDLRADRGVIELARERLPKLGDDVWVAGTQQPAARRGGPLPLLLDLRLDLGDDLAINAHGLEGKLTGRVDFATNPEGELRAYGRVQTVNATLFAYGQRLQVEPGILVFDGPIDNPTIQMTAWRRNLPVEAGVQVTGTARAPRLQVVSQPPVPEGERIAWLVLGRPPSDATKADLGMLQVAAGALLARGDAMPLDRKIARAFGLDELTLRGTGEAQDRVVALGKRLSDRLYVSYEQGIGTVASNLVKMDYSLSRRWSLRAETGTSSGGGLFYRFSWD